MLRGVNNVFVCKSYLCSHKKHIWLSNITTRIMSRTPHVRRRARTHATKQALLFRCLPQTSQLQVTVSPRVGRRAGDGGGRGAIILSVANTVNGFTRLNSASLPFTSANFERFPPAMARVGSEREREREQGRLNLSTVCFCL